ncbi:MAG: hypothetical protein K0Q51_1316 [Rickettsiaceae bacterium]|nr:hypothetical protein [Rickettsiaceae bacterium]
MNKLTKEEAINVLKAWSTIEVLSPQVFLKPENLAGGDPLAIATFDKEWLPWESGEDNPKPKTKIFYQVVVGILDFEKAIAALLEKYSHEINLLYQYIYSPRGQKLEFNLRAPFNMMVNFGRCVEWLLGPDSNQRPNG